ncbi:flagellar motor protein MotA [Microvirga tunisiensis]|uniref:Flagellar motor protein MotA n=2 Tax=Pannonibacter tanglangensis TaxID=2750084 RepID=A0ABW9ZKB0_9HYPH|nr:MULTISPECIES: flagellar motor protein MotA [unclassified Pannonibacter]NBN65261.1 flagellar motor protein MotA [Pannonibacter sp. XCT-34]NBN79762.1 flagellar motor protein MotA [Pannonibacter sp. XCT-53]
MARDFDPYSLSSPKAYLSIMIIFLVIVAFIAFILSRQIAVAFMSSPGLNGLIVLVGVFGIFLTFGRVIRLFPEIHWVNGFRIGDPGIEVRRPPVLLAPMATLLGNKVGEMTLTPTTARSILDSIGMRLDEAREIARYMTGLLVFLGLLGTFWGLLQTVGSVGATIQSLDVGSGDANAIFGDLKAGLEAPLAGMGTAFSSSLFGLTGSLVLGFLDLQAGQAQNRFYTELEDWLSTVTAIEPEDRAAPAAAAVPDLDKLQLTLERLQRAIEEGGGKAANQAMANLAEGIQGLVKHVRSEQQMMREWAETQTAQQKRIETLLTSISAAFDRAKE